MNTDHPIYEQLRKRLGHVIWAYFGFAGPRDLDDSDVDRLTELALGAVDKTLAEYLKTQGENERPGSLGYAQLFGLEQLLPKLPEEDE